jgi:hypothetical protein
MEFDRRHLHRFSPEELSYIQFEPEGGGIVLNASEEGLAFHSATVIRRSGTIQLCISPNPKQRIELVAEVAWNDETQKSIRPRFIHSNKPRYGEFHELSP